MMSNIEEFDSVMINNDLKNRDIIIRKIKKNCKGIPKGYIVGTKNGIGYSLCCNKDEFNSNVGRSIALKRAIKKNISINDFPPSITQSDEFEEFMSNYNRYFHNKEIPYAKPVKNVS